jgi:hypothetical protein
MANRPGERPSPNAMITRLKTAPLASKVAADVQYRFPSTTTSVECSELPALSAFLVWARRH